MASSAISDNEHTSGTTEGLVNFHPVSEIAQTWVNSVIVFIRACNVYWSEKQTPKSFFQINKKN